MGETLSQNDPPTPLSYTTLIETAFSSIRAGSSLEAFLGLLDAAAATDIAAGFGAAVEAGSPLPTEVRSHSFLFRDDQLGRGWCGLTLRHNELVEFRGQLFFPGALGWFGSRRYFRTVLVPLYERFMGSGMKHSRSGATLFSASGLFGTAQRTLLPASVLAWLSDQRNLYMTNFGKAPSEADLQRYFGVSPAGDLAPQ